MSIGKNNPGGDTSKSGVDETIEQLIVSGVFEVTSEAEITSPQNVPTTGTVVTFPTAPQSGESIWAAMPVSEIKHVYHPHTDAIRIRVLEEIVERLMTIVEKDPDSPSEVSKLRQDFQGWRSELKDSTIVDHVYVPTYEINYQSLPYRLNVKGLSTKPPSAE